MRLPARLAPAFRPRPRLISSAADVARDPTEPPMRSFLLSFCPFLLPTIAAAADADKLTLKKGDRIVFLGDSITQAGAGPKGYVTLARKALDDKGVEVIGAGISGNKVPD